MHKSILLYYATVLIIVFFLSLAAGLKIIFATPNFLLKYRASFLRNRWVFIGCAISIYFAVFSILSISKYNAYNMGMVDLGRMSQAIWNTLNGRLLVNTFEFGNVSRLIVHSEIIYLLIAPLYMFYPDPKMLLVFQSLVISIGAIPIYWLARDKFKDNFTATCFSCAYLLYPALQYGNLADFHPDMLATTFLLFTFYYLEKRKWQQYFIFLLLSLICKEYVSLVLITLGIYIFFKQKNPKISGITILLGIFWFILTYKIIPAFLCKGKENMMVELYGHLGSSIKEISKTIILHPVNTVLRFVTFEKKAILLLLFLPVGFLCFLNIPTLLIGLPILLGNILTDYFTYTNHHNGTLIPFIFVSAIMGGQYLANKFTLRFKNICCAIGIFVFISSLLSNIFYGPSPLSWRFWNKSSYRYWANKHQFRITEHDRIADSFVKMIPQEARVSASNHLASHLSQRQTIYHFPEPRNFENIDYILVDLLEYFPPHWNPRKDEIDTLRKLFLDRGFTLKAWQDGILLFQKEPTKDQGYRIAYRLIKDAKPEYPVGLAFNGKLLLLGYDLNRQLLPGGYKFHIIYYWRVLEDFEKGFSYTYFNSTEQLEKSFIVIDEFKSQTKKFRVVHLPLYILYTPTEWKVGEIIKEEIEFYLAADIFQENFNWQIGLYVVPQSFFIDTQNKNLVPGTRMINLEALNLKRG